MRRHVIEGITNVRPRNFHVRTYLRTLGTQVWVYKLNKLIILFRHLTEIVKTTIRQHMLVHTLFKIHKAVDPDFLYNEAKRALTSTTLF